MSESTDGTIYEDHVRGGDLVPPRVVCEFDAVDDTIHPCLAMEF